VKRRSFISTAGKVTLNQPTQYVGGWQIGGRLGFRLAMTYKPNWFHRKMMYLLLGIEWFDGPVI
jgi:hypothetical protein